MFVSAALTRLGSLLRAKPQTRYAILDQGLVSGLGFVTSIVAARLLGLQGFGLFAIAMIFAGLAQGLQNALLVAPIMTLAGTSRGRSRAFYASSLSASLVAASGLAFATMILYAGFAAAQGKPFGLGVTAATGAFAFAQTLVLTVRRILFALGQGGSALALDACRGAALLLAVFVLADVPDTDGVAGVLFAIAVATLGPACCFAWPIIWRARARLRGRAVVRRCWPMAKWMTPSVVATFGQEQLVWLLVGFALGDAAVGGLRAAQYLVNLAYPFLAALENVVPIQASRVYVAGGRPALRAYILKAMLAYSPLACGFPIVAAATSTFWLRLFFGRSFEAFDTCLQIFALAVLFIFIRDLLGYFFRATQEVKIMFRAFALSMVVTLLLIVPLIHLAGAVGAAAGIVLGHALSMGYMVVRAVRGPSCQAEEHRSRVAY